ncbi:hypothetical protein RISK_003020 [Rhodopirellula islandica]|uniref:Uncharacterized protein n=1 Tax=Rhodopirellula islandica TaxID=595434 RepID=A0A0J1BDS8_RHOIS|nr:hypothetical protein RISK_003020 [Rhodopirellula islandica]
MWNESRNMVGVNGRLLSAAKAYSSVFRGRGLSVREFVVNS